MRLSLGEQSYDLRTRALVVGVLDVVGQRTVADVGRDAARLAADGADVIELGLGAWSCDPGPLVEALVATVPTPIGVATGDASVALASCRAGARLVNALAEDVWPAAGAAVVVAGQREAEAAHVHGITHDRIVVGIGDGSGIVLGRYPLLVSTANVAAMAVSVTLGCRLVRTGEVRAARRVCDVLAAVQEASA